MSYLCYLCLFLHSGVQNVLTILVTWRVSYKTHELLTIREHLVHSPFCGEVRVPHLFSFWCFVFLRPVLFVNPMLPVFLDCSMLIYPSLFSNIYLRRSLQFVFSLFTREA